MQIAKCKLQQRRVEKGERRVERTTYDVTQMREWGQTRGNLPYGGTVATNDTNDVLTEALWGTSFVVLGEPNPPPPPKGWG